MLYLMGQTWRGKAGKVMYGEFGGTWYVFVSKAGEVDPLVLQCKNEDDAKETFDVWKREVALRELPRQTTKIKIAMALARTNLRKQEEKVDQLKNDPDASREDYDREVSYLEGHRSRFDWWIKELERRYEACFVN